MAHFKSSRGLNWHYTSVGSGETVLLIHGFGGSLRWWDLQNKFLGQHHQVICVDLPGHGQSAWMPVTLQDMALDIKQILCSVRVDHLSVVASSFGGLVATELYRIMGDHVMRISYVGSIPKFARGSNYPAGLDINNIRKLSGQFDTEISSVLDMFFRSLFTTKERESAQFQWVKEMHKQEPLPQREALKCFLDILEKADLRDRLSSIICPVQYITGSDDYICPKSVMDWMAEHAYNARFDFIDGCGHLPFLTEVNEYNRLLEDFLIN